MIKVNRPMPGPAVLSYPNGPGPKETAKAVELFEKKSAPGATDEDVKKANDFEFKAYKLDDVKQALERAFLGKCAYCESRYAATQPMDVEHWRPKGLVVEENGDEVGGYYWLAANWENLLPSCIDCNRARSQRSAEDGSMKLLGKANRFPIEEGTSRATGPTGVESPLLLNPCIDEPDEHLRFDDEAVALHTSPKGRASIDVYGLNRFALVLERRQVLKLMRYRMTNIVLLIRILDRRPVDGTARGFWDAADDVLRHEIACLLEFQRPDRPYALLARQTIAKFRKMHGLESNVENLTDK